ncbi:MAG TPA: type IV pilus twitching motility protein PilT [Actinomycetota bacterium]|nr:type IV pilus twitching motility protein PilT [Actinomycetota bacterium]
MSMVQEEQDIQIPVPELLELMLDKGASDLHLTAGAPPTIRLHGELERLEEYPVLSPRALQGMVYAILPQKFRERLEQELELDMSYALPGKARFRVNVYFQRDSIGAAFRLIPYEIKDVDSLGLPPVVKDLARFPRGFVVVTGPTGSGKSTTLAGMVDIVNNERAGHIMTVEDPIEFLHKHKKSIVNQREVGADTHGFAQALKHVLRQDPDVILVGEMRDLETISTAITAAETGHLVFATLHTQDAPQTIDRIIDVFPPHQQQQVRVQLSTTLQGVVTQQLLQTVDGQGRAVAVEILVATPAVRNLIREGKTHQIYSSMQAGGRFGMQTMDMSLSTLVKAGKISQQLAYERCHDPEELQRLLGGSGGSSDGYAPGELEGEMLGSGGGWGDSFGASGFGGGS